MPWVIKILWAIINIIIQVYAAAGQINKTQSARCSFLNIHKTLLSVI